MNRKSAWTKYDGASMNSINAFAREYRGFIDHCKTERECAAELVKTAKAAGYADLEQIVREHRPLKPGDRVFRNWMNKSVVMFIVGRQPLADGMQILGAHIDSPRIDLKQNPLYEEDGLAYLDTQYYGGIKKYQWVALPLAMHGVIVRIDGSVLNVSIGETRMTPYSAFPIFCRTSLTNSSRRTAKR